MLRRFLGRRQRPFTCTDVDANVEQVRDGRLSAWETAAFKAHVAKCNACRQRLQTETAWLSTLQATPAPARLTPTERRAMQQALGRQMRRRMVMRNIRLSVQQVAVLGVLALVVGAMVWWQTAVTPTENLDNLTTTELSDTAPSAENQEAEQITLQFAVSDLDRSQYGRLIPLFEEVNPDIHIQLVSLDEILGADDGQLPEDTAAKMAVAADVFPSLIGPGDTQAGLVGDLTPFIQADSDFQPEDYPDGILDQFRWQGGLWAIPLAADVELVFFNKAHFDEASLTYPAPGWTWDEFATAAIALTQRDGNEVVRWGYLSSPVDRVPLIVAQAGALVSASSDPPFPRFTAPEVVEATDAYVSLMAELTQPENPDRLIQSIFAEGKVSIWPGSLHEWDTFAELSTIGVTPFPTGTGARGTSLISVRGLSMSSGTQHPEAAWRWMSFLSRQHLNFPFSPLPLRQSVATTLDYWDSLEPELATALQGALDQVYISHRDVSLRHFLTAIDAALAGELSVTDSLANAQERTIAEITGVEVVGASTPAPTIVVSPPEEPILDENVTTITFGRQDRLFGTTAFDLLLEQFQQEHPDIHVEFVSIGLLGGLMTLPDLATEANCFQWFPRLHDANNRASVLNLEPLMDADNFYNVGDFFPAAIVPFTVQGQLWGLPASGRPYLIEYNKDIFDAANVTYPSPQWTTDDFLNIAVTLTQGEGTEKIYGFVPENFEAASMLALSERLGAVWIDNAVDPPRTAFNNSATVDAIRWYLQLATEFGVKPNFGPTQLEDRDSLITENRAAMWISLNPGNYQTLNMGVAPLPFPAYGGGETGFTQLSGYFISSSASLEARQACWQWITFLTEQPNASWGFPANRSVAESEAYRQQVGPELADAYLASIGDGDQLVAGNFAEQAEWIRVTQWWVVDAYDKVVAGESDLETALADAQSLADAYRNCVIDNGATTDEAAQWACVQELDEDLYSRFQGDQ